MTFIVTTFVIFLMSFIGVPIGLALARLFGLYTIVHECHAKVYILFGKVLGVLDEPGLHFPMATFGPRAGLVFFFGRVADIDLRLDQVYLRSQPVNTEEGTPMGIGVWYEMRVREAVASSSKTRILPARSALTLPTRPSESYRTCRCRTCWRIGTR